MTAPEPAAGSAGDRLAAVRRLEPTALGSRALQRLTGLAARLLGADAASVSLLGDVETVVGGDGLPPGTSAARSRSAESLCAVALAGGAARRSSSPTRPRTAASPACPGRGGHGRRATSPCRWWSSTARAVGALAVYAHRPRDWADSDATLLRQLADSVATELELSALGREFEAHRLRFELAIDAAEIGSFDWDLVTGRLVWDDRLVRALRLRPGHLRRDDRGVPRPAATPTTATARWTRCRRPIDTCGEFDAEFRIVLPTGETRWVQGRGRVARRRRRQRRPAARRRLRHDRRSGTATRGSPGCSRR